jgi:ADP-ribosylglycohydrolase
VEREKMKKQILADHIKGMIYGQVLGDAVGLTNGFQFKRDQNPINFPYQQSIRNFPVCDWTNDQMILILETIIESNHNFKNNPLGDDTYQNFAKKFLDWRLHGFSELGDKIGVGLNEITNTILTHPQFKDDPFQSSCYIWLKSGKTFATNEAIMRTSILSTLYLMGSDSSSYWNDIRRFCEMTNFDGRCVISCWTLVEILRALLCISILKNKAKIYQKVKVDVFKSVCQKIKETDIFRQLPPEVKIEDELLYYFNTPLINLKLDENVGYTFKCMGCAIWALDIVCALSGRDRTFVNNTKNDSSDSIRSTLDFKKIIIHLVKEGGDASANAAVAGSVIGAFLGYKALPQDWIMLLPNRLWLDKKIEMLLNKMKLI